ncbi:MAG: glycine zipper 2TM domain-containing protein [Gallionella sp.]|nr:glycine zipper 2TM domain-containing protein [Gallionella sp.]
MKTQSSTLIRSLLAIAAISAVTACSPKPANEDNAAQTKAIVDQAVAETKKQMLAEQAAEKSKQEALAAEEAATKAKQDAAVAQAVAEAKKEFAAEQHAAAAKAKKNKAAPAHAPAAAAPVATNGSASPVTSSVVPKKIVCTTCGVIVSIHEVEIAGKGSGLGVVAGGVVGGLLGNQVGQGSGRDLATIAGAIGGAVAGNKIEQNSKKAKSYNITVKMETGEEVVYHQATLPNFVKGDPVRIENDVVVKK